MEYSFGCEYIRGVITDVVKVKSDKPVNLSGSFTVERKYTDAIYTDSFVIEKRIRAKLANGIYYTWYAITNHVRYVDRFTPGIVEVKASIEETQDALCEASDDTETRLAEIEDALCELTEE